MSDRLLVMPRFLPTKTCAVFRAEYAGRLSRGGFRPQGAGATHAPAAVVVPSTLGTLVADVGAALTAFFPECGSLEEDYVSYTRLHGGTSLPVHADAVTESGSAHHTPDRVVTGLLYLNDSGKDFDGGVIRFPGLGEEVVPAAGTLVGFRSSWEYRHEVTRVSRGHRDALAFWFKGGDRAVTYKQSWVAGLTTVPERRATLLPRTLASLRGAGFDAPRLFVDGIGSDEVPSWEREFGLEVTARNPRIRTFGNWMLGLAELYIRTPTATRFAMFQDDFVTYKNLRGYLDRCPFPPGSYLNLFTSPKNPVPADRPGWHPATGKGQGAVALVFSRDAVRSLLTQQHTVDRPLDPHRGHRQIDGGIWNAFHKVGVKELVHSPSLVQHIGRKSTMSSPGDNHDNQADAPTFKGEEFDALTMLPVPVPATKTQCDAWEEERAALENAIRDDVVRMQKAASAGERAKFKSHIDRYKGELERHLLNAP